MRLNYDTEAMSPVALLLSGGLDSSAIAKVTDNLIEKGELEQNDIHAYIASFPNFKDDETAIAREFIKRAAISSSMKCLLIPKTLLMILKKTI